MTPTVTIKGYELREQIGAGGFGAVYRAYQPTIGREVAIKVILPSLASQLDFIRRFESEAQLVARLEHPHVTPLYDYWRDPEGAYLVMRWLRGGSLREALQHGAFELHVAALLLDQIAGALSVAHRNNVIHRDVKPGNILLDEDGNAYLTDFGIAKDLNLPGSHTQPDAILGSLDYISPEQARSEPITPRTDIYSLGVTIYEMITGAHPFPNITALERLYRHINDPLPEVAALGTPENTVAINRVIQKATAKNPQNRYPDALAFAADFRTAVALGHTPVSLIELLTQREHEILHLIMEGVSNKEIAQRLTVTLSTVKWYVNQIYAKLGVRSRVQAMVRARELNLLVKQEGATVIGVLPTEDFRPSNPYKGLQAFQSADNQVFFGRENATAHLLERLGETSDMSRFLAVVGPSGSGKSSLVKAGLIPALWRGDLRGSEKWFVVEMLPGARPLDALEIALTKVAANQSKNLREHLTRDAHGLVRVAELILPDDNSDLVLIIDQFEELFTLVVDETERRHFLDLLVTAVTAPRTRVRLIVTLRADFYDRPLHYSDFAALLHKRLETILPLSAHELERAIAKPAEGAGVTFEPGLITSIVADVNYQPGALPLLQYALTELFERRYGRILTRQAYIELGGAVGALAKRAEKVYTELTPEDQELARQMFLRLVTLNEGTEDTRRRVPRTELLSLSHESEPVDDLIDTFAAYRLLSLDNDSATRIPTVEVAHEALLREWKQLRQWINENRDEIKMQQQLAQLTESWVKGAKDSSYLFGGLRLEQLEQWAKDSQLMLTADERAYLDASIAHRETEHQAEKERKAREISLERRSQTFLRGLVAVFAVATVVALLLTGLAVNQSQIAQAERDTAQVERERAEAQTRVAQARELVGYSKDTLETDGELATLLALQAMNLTYQTDGVVLPEAETVLHQAVQTLNMPIQVPIEKFPVDWILYFSYSPDGTRIAYPVQHSLVTEREPFTGIADAITGQFLYKVTGDMMMSVGISPLNQIVTQAKVDGIYELQLWDVSSDESGQLVSSVEMFFPAWTDWLDITSDFQYAITAYESGPTQVWNLATGQEIVTPDIEKFPQRNGKPQFSPDGSLLVNQDIDGTLSILSTSNWQEILRLSPSGARIMSFAFSSDSTNITTGSNNDTVTVWDALTGVERYTISSNVRPSFTSLSADGTRLSIGAENGQVAIWDTQAQQEVVTLSVSRSGGMILSPDGTHLASLHGDRLQIWNLLPRSEFLTLFNGSVIKDTSAPVGLAYSPDGKRLIIASSTTSPVIRDAQTGEKLMTLSGHGELVSNLAWSGDGTRIATGDDGGNVRIWNATTGEEFLTLTGQTSRIYSLAFSPDNTKLASSSLDTTIRIWDVVTGKSLQTLNQNGESKGVSWSPDGTRIAAGTNFMSDQNAYLRVWNVLNGELQLDVPVGNNRVSTVNFNSNGTQILTGLLEGNISVIWDAETGEKLLTLAGGHIDNVVAAIYTPDGKQIATSGHVADSTIKLWDAVTGQQLLTHSNTGTSLRIAFSPDGKYLATLNMDGTTRIYLVNVEDLIALAKSRLTRTLTDAECQRYLHLEACPAQ